MGGSRRSSRDSAGSAGALRNPGGRDRLAQCGDQRRQVFLIAPPALEGGSIYRLAYLRQACGLHRPLRAVEIEASFVPGQAAEIDDPASLRRQIIYQVFVLHVEQGARRKNPTPMIHQIHIHAILAAELAKIVSEAHIVEAEALRET